MFGKEKIQLLETQLRELNNQLEQARKEKAGLEEKLAAARQQTAELEQQLANSDLETLKEELRASKAEYEGLKDLYTKKIQAFDTDKEEKEQAFAREAALERHNLENEIRDNRQANRDYVRNTVKTFSESYNYYLDQIKILMDALGNVAANTGEMLFMESNDNLKARFGQQMADRLQSDKESLKSDTGDLILIGSAEVAEPVAEEWKAEEPAAAENEEAEVVEEAPAVEEIAQEVIPEEETAEEETAEE